MTVGELIADLEQYDESTEVMLDADDGEPWTVDGVLFEKDAVILFSSEDDNAEESISALEDGD